MASGAPPVERLNPAVQQQLNLKSLRTRAVSLFKAVTRILEELDGFARANATPKWHDIVGQFSMVNMELYNIVEEMKSVSKAFVVYPKNVTAENATILPVMLSSKLLPEMEAANNAKAGQLLQGLQGLPVAAQIDKLKARINMIELACESAEKIIDEARKSHFGVRQGPSLLPTVDKVQVAKLKEQEKLLRNAVNHGEGLRIPADKRQVTSSLPMHMVDILTANNVTRSFQASSGTYQKNTPPLGSSSSNNNQNALLQASGAQLIGRSAASPSSDNSASSPLYANSPRSGANMRNTPSPQQQSHQQQHQLQRQRTVQLSQQQLRAQQQLRQPSVPGLGQGRQLTSAAMLMGLNQHTQGNQLNRQLNQSPSPANSALYNAAQTTLTSQMFGMPGANRALPSQNLSTPAFGMGADSSVVGRMAMQQHGSPSSFGNIQQHQGAQNLQ